MDGKAILVDISLCTGCRGCQVACKQWNNLPATHTEQTGSYQNPPDMNGDTYKVVKFYESEDKKNGVRWDFITDMCRHCVFAPCQMGAMDDEAILMDDDTGAIVFTDKAVADDYDGVFGSCPYAIPHINEKTQKLTKCTMCNDRIKAGKLPACVLSCPTGAMVFGDREEILEKVHARVEELKPQYPNAHALDADDVRVIYILTDTADNYGNIAGN